MANFYKTLLLLRKNNKAVWAGEAAGTTHMVKTSGDKNLVGFLRKQDDQEVLVFLNMTRSTVNFELDDDQVQGKFTNIFTGKTVDLSVNKQIELDAWGYLVVEK